jgi:hypothetical protein
MSTPVMAFGHYVKWMLAGFWVLWLTTLLVSRIFIFHEAYTAHVAKVQDEKWLSSQCNTPEFYSNIRQHTDLCEAVYANSRTSACLVGLNAMATSTYVCGAKPCVEILQDLFVRMGWQAMALVVCLFVFAPNLFILLYRSICGRPLTSDESLLLKKNQFYSSSPYFQDLQSSQLVHFDNGLRTRKPDKGNVVKMV